MKIFALVNSDALALPTLVHLNNEGMLVGVAIIRKAERVLLPRLQQLNLGVEPIVLDRSDWQEVLTEALRETGATTAWTLTFPWKIPTALLTIPDKGFINFHFGILPKYKGIDPIFWQLKNMEDHGGVTIHLMNAQVDEGPVIIQEKVPILLGENYGLHCMKLGQFIPSLVDRVIAAQADEQFSYLELKLPEKLFDQKPTGADLSIDWKTQSAIEIESLVNSANPKYGGARTTIGALELYVLEVTPVDMQGEVKAEPGQIVHADALYGLVVCCSDKECLRITVVRTGEGYLSGVKLFNLGFGLGQTFV